MKAIKIITAIIAAAIITASCESVCVQCTYVDSNNIVNDSGEICTTQEKANELKADWQQRATDAGTTANCTMY